MENLAKNLKVLIAREGISEAELSRRCGVTQPMINRIVNAKTDNPKLKTLLRISRYFGISITELVEAKMTEQQVEAAAADTAAA
jgi:transcriptional regulator with XRE-family HTH domain